MNTPDKPELKQRIQAGSGRVRLVFLPTFKMVDEFIRNLKHREHSSIALMKKKFASESNANLTCPVTARRHLYDVAEAALLELKHGRILGDITPFWRIMDASDTTAKKLSCGTDFISQRRNEEMA